MTIKFENSKEAFLAVLYVGLSADNVGSLAERDYLFKQVKEMSLYKDMELTAFNDLCGTVMDKMFSTLPTKEDGRLTTAGVDELLHEVRNMLDANQLKQLVRMTTELCAVDSVSQEEKKLLHQVEQKLTAGQASSKTARR